MGPHEACPFRLVDLPVSFDLLVVCTGEYGIAKNVEHGTIMVQVCVNI
jgi:hypothetical protein